MRLTLDLDSEMPATERLQNFCIYIAPQPSQFLILNGNQTLQQVNEKFWKVKKQQQKIAHFNSFVTKIGFIFRTGQQADGNVLCMEEVLNSTFDIV